MESILKFMRLNETIDELDLSNSEFNSKKVYLLAKALVQKEFEIRKLDLSNNKAIKDKDCITLKNIFSRQSSVKYLFLDDNSISAKGIESITEGIVENLKVHTLSFRRCQVKLENSKVSKQPEWKTIIQNMQQNCSLTLLDLEENKVSQDFLDELDVEIQKNKLIVENIFPEIRK